MRRSVVFIGVLLLLFTGYLLFGSSGKIEAGNSNTGDESESNQILQNAVFTDLNGNEVTLQDFQGKTVLIDIWETWCVPCLRSMPTFQKLMDDYPDDFVVLAVSPGYMDSEEQVREFIANNDYDFVFVFGEQLAQDLQVQSIPYKIYVSPSGEYIKSVLGSQGPDSDYENTRQVIESYL